MARKHKATIATPHGPRVCFQATVERQDKKPLVARFGGIPLRRQRKAVIDDRLPVPPAARKELVTRLQAGWCEWCERGGKVEVHQVRRLADLEGTRQPQPEWALLMARRRRKTLVVCPDCHKRIHARPEAMLT